VVVSDIIAAHGAIAVSEALTINEQRFASGYRPTPFLIVLEKRKLRMHFEIRSITAAILASTLIFAAPVFADAPLRTGRWAVEGGLGFTVDPDMFMFATGLAYGVREDLQIVTTVQWAVEDGGSVISPSAALRYLIPLGRGSRGDGTEGGNDHRDPLSNLAPFVHAGLGFSHIDPDGAGSETEFLLDFGLGADYALNRDWSLVTVMRFNTLPAEDDWFYSWQVLGAQYRF
jgi:hypothetical protein